MSNLRCRRRRYLNLALSQAVPAYARTLSEYTQALTQRNALLKALSENGGAALSLSKGNSNQLEVWDEALVKSGAQIILWRIQAIQEIERLASRVLMTRTGAVVVYGASVVRGEHVSAVRGRRVDHVSGDHAAPPHAAAGKRHPHAHVEIGARPTRAR